MKNMRRLAALAAAACLALSGCGGQEMVQEETNDATPVQTRTVELDTISASTAVSGKVVSDNEASIFVAASVKCLDTYCEAGDTVQAGDVICTLDLASTLASYNAASISYQSSADSYRNQSAVFADQIALYQKNVSDLKALYEIGAASQIEIDQAELQLESAIATRDSTLSQLEAAMNSYKSQLEQLSTVLEDVDGSGNVVAPMDGTLVSLNAEAGSFISNTMPVAVIDAADAMKVTVSVSESLVPKLSIGDTAGVSISAVNQRFEGTIRSVEKAANAQTKLYTVTLSVPSGTEGLLSGMFADVTFYTDTSEDAVVIPTEAILTSGSVQYVFTVADGTAHYVEVTTGLTGDGVTEITAGLSAGDELVTVGQSYLSEGAAVRVVSGGDEEQTAGED